MSSQYTDLVKVGKGTYGTVYSAFDTERSEQVAIKRLLLHTEREGIPCTTLREIAVLKYLKHPNIVELKSILRTQNHLQIIFEFCEWDLGRYIKENDGYIPYTQVISFTRQILSGLAYMHAKKVMHRDIKPQNILVNAKREIKLCDFGLCRSTAIPVSGYSHEVITQWYRPPEILKGNDNYDEKADIWGVGCVVAEMLKGTPLFQCETKKEQLKEIKRILGSKGKALENEIGHCDKGMFELLLMMLDPSPATRISAEDALKHRALK